MALDILTSTIPNLIAFDLYAVQPMDNRVGMINYLDYTYESNKGAVKAGDVFNSALYGSISNAEYTSEAVTGEEVTLTSKVGHLVWTPVNVANDVKAFNGTTELTKVAETATPSTGEFKVSADGTITVGDSLTKVTVNYTFMNEDVRSNGYNSGNTSNIEMYDGATGVSAFTNVPEIGLVMRNVPITAKARTLRAYWAFDSAYELNKEYGQNIEELLATQASGEIAHEIDIELTNDLLAIGKKNPSRVVWSKTQPIGVSLADHYDGFQAVVNEGANAINQATRRVRANFMVCGLEVLTVLSVMRNFKASGNIANGPYYAGTLGDIKVYVSPDYPSDEFVLGYKGNSMFEAGAFYTPYMPVTSTDLLTDADFRGQRAWATMYGKKIINDKLYLAGKITA